MAESEKLMELSILNPTPSRLPGPNLLHNLIKAATNSKHDQPAIDFLDENEQRHVVSYDEFDNLSERLATRISKQLHELSAETGRGQLIIPLMIPQSPNLYVALIAILKSGAAFCPMNLDTPGDRIRFILQDIDARLVVTTSALVQQISTAVPNVTLICVDEHQLSSSQREIGQDCGPCRRVPCEDDLAYVMYTSGSTGTPKGVGITHIAASQSLLAHDRHIPNFSRFLQFAAPTFDVSVFELFFPLFRGNTLVCLDRAEMLTDLPRMIRQMEIDACELTPSVAGSLLRSRAAAPGLKLVLTIGEMLTEPVVTEFGGDSQIQSLLWGMYGPTEATIHWYD